MDNIEFYLMAFTTGLLGAGHCMGMCGGLVAALALSPEGKRGGILFHLLYNLGRTFTYTSIGVGVGWLGSIMAYRSTFRPITRYLLVGSDLFVILVGLGTAGAFAGISFLNLEFKGPIGFFTLVAQKLKSFPPAVAGFPIGTVFGFLPCGFLYAMLITAAQTASPVSGGITMLLFGLGTIPALLLFGTLAHKLSSTTRIWMMRAAGLLVAVMGSYNLYRHLKMLGWVGSAAMHMGSGMPGGMGH